MQQIGQLKPGEVSALEEVTQSQDPGLTEATVLNHDVLPLSPPEERSPKYSTNQRIKEDTSLHLYILTD